MGKKRVENSGEPGNVRRPVKSTSGKFPGRPKKHPDIFWKLMVVFLLALALQNYWIYKKSQTMQMVPAVIKRSPLADIYDAYRNSVHVDPAIAVQMTNFENMLNNLQDSGSEDFMPVIYTDSNAVIIKIFIPGLKKMNIKTVVKENTLQVTGSRKAAWKPDTTQKARLTGAFGSFTRQFDFPFALGGRKIVVEEGNDVLEITVPCPSPVIESGKTHKSLSDAL